jgi:hypothetical protein
MTLPSESTFPETAPPKGHKVREGPNPMCEVLPLMSNPNGRQGKKPKEKYTASLAFRLSALKLQVHERYKPLQPSPLRNVVSVLDLPDVPGPDVSEVSDPSDTDSFLDSLLNSPSSCSPSPSDDGFWEPRTPTPDELDRVDGLDGTVKEGGEA